MRLLDFLRIRWRSDVWNRTRWTCSLLASLQGDNTLTHPDLLRAEEVRFSHIFNEATRALWVHVHHTKVFETINLILEFCDLDLARIWGDYFVYDRKRFCILLWNISKEKRPMVFLPYQVWKSELNEVKLALYYFLYSIFRTHFSVKLRCMYNISWLKYENTRCLAIRKSSKAVQQQAPKLRL